MIAHVEAATREHRRRLAGHDAETPHRQNARGMKAETHQLIAKVDK
jgi:hypothetical protein